MLTDIYSWFTEGFDTTDLEEANTLLDDLRAWSLIGGKYALLEMRE